MSTGRHQRGRKKGAARRRVKEEQPEWQLVQLDIVKKWADARAMRKWDDIVIDTSSFKVLVRTVMRKIKVRRQQLFGAFFPPWITTKLLRWRMHAEERAKDNRWDKMARALVMEMRQLGTVTEMHTQEHGKFTLQQQGNTELVSAKHLKARSALLNDKFVLQTIGGLWARMPKSSAEGYENHVSLCEYKWMYDKLVGFLVPASFSGSANSSLALMKEDWTRDADGQQYMSERQFRRSIFHLVDTWSNDVTRKAYMDFMSDIKRVVFDTGEVYIRSKYERWLAIQEKRLGKGLKGLTNSTLPVEDTKKSTKEENGFSLAAMLNDDLSSEEDDMFSLLRHCGVAREKEEESSHGSEDEQKSGDEEEEPQEEEEEQTKHKKKLTTVVRGTPMLVRLAHRVEKPSSSSTVDTAIAPARAYGRPLSASSTNSSVLLRAPSNLDTTMLNKSIFAAAFSAKLKSATENSTVAPTHRTSLSSSRSNLTSLSAAKPTTTEQPVSEPTTAPPPPNSSPSASESNLKNHQPDAEPLSPTKTQEGPPSEASAPAAPPEPENSQQADKKAVVPPLQKISSLASVTFGGHHTTQIHTIPTTHSPVRASPPPPKSMSILGQLRQANSPSPQPEQKGTLQNQSPIEGSAVQGSAAADTPPRVTKPHLNRVKLYKNAAVSIHMQMSGTRKKKKYVPSSTQHTVKCASSPSSELQQDTLSLSAADATLSTQRDTMTENSENLDDESPPPTLASSAKLASMMMSGSSPRTLSSTWSAVDLTYPLVSNRNRSQHQIAHSATVPSLRTGTCAPSVVEVELGADGGRQCNTPQKKKAPFVGNKQGRPPRAKGFSFCSMDACTTPTSTASPTVNRPTKRGGSRFVFSSEVV